MPYINDYLMDLALAYPDVSGNRLDICSQEPSTFVGATTTYTLGNKVGITISAPADRSPDGRKVTVSAITDGSITGAGTATHWAISDTTNSRLIAAGALSAGQVVTPGNTFSLSALDIGISDAVAG
jgi:hypothetical protein